MKEDGTDTWSYAESGTTGAYGQVTVEIPLYSSQIGNTYQIIAFIDPDDASGAFISMDVIDYSISQTDLNNLASAGDVILSNQLPLQVLAMDGVD